MDRGPHCRKSSTGWYNFDSVKPKKKNKCQKNCKHIYCDRAMKEKFESDIERGGEQ